jgi:hypothetical protein
VVDPGEECDDGNDDNADECTNSCAENLGYHMNGIFYVSDALHKGNFNAGGGFCTNLVGQVAYIAGNNANLPNPESLTWQGNDGSPHSAHNCMAYTVTSNNGWGQYGQYGLCSVPRHVACTTNPTYCNGYGPQFCHLWD